MEPLARQLEAVRRDLASVGDAILDDSQLIANLLTSGKLTRARLTFAGAALGERGDDERVHRLAVGAELFHQGALFHDDLIDGSRTRRGRPATWWTHGPRVAVLVGSAVVLRAAECFAPESIEIRRGVARFVRSVVRGHLDQESNRFLTDVSPETYRNWIRAKTGGLYAMGTWCGALGAAARPEAVDAATSWTWRIGEAFQLVDDVRDLVGAPGLRRAPGTDFRRGIYAHPILSTLAGRYASREPLLKFLAAEGPDAFPRCVDLLRRNGAVAGTLRLVETLCSKARMALRQGVPARRWASLARLEQDLVGCLPSLDGPISDHEAGSERRPPTRPQTMSESRLLATTDRCIDAGRHARAVILRRLAEAPRLLTLTMARAAAIVVMVAELAAQVTHDAAAVAEDDEVASIVHEVDLLLSDFFALLPDLPAPVAAAVCGAGARWLGATARLAVVSGGSADRPGVSSVEMLAESIAAAL